MLTEAERAFRRTHLCSSDVQHAARIGPFASPMKLWEDKVLGLDAIPNEVLEVGHLVEPIVAELYQRRRGCKLETSTTLEHPRHKWMAATPDRVLASERLLVEIKFVGVGSAPFWGEDGTDEIPDHYRAQVEHQLEVTGLQRADVAALIGTELRVYRIERDPVLAKELLEAARAFWFRYVVPEIPPPVDATEACSAYLARRFPRKAARAELLEMPPIVAAALLEYREAKAAIEAAEARKAGAANRLKALIGESGASGFRDPELGSVTWKTTASSGVSWEAVAEELRVDLGFALEQLRQVSPDRAARMRSPEEAWATLLERHRGPGHDRLDQRLPRKAQARVKPEQVREFLANFPPKPSFAPTFPRPQQTLALESHR